MTCSGECPMCTWKECVFCFIFLFFFNLFLIVTEREAETQAEVEVGSMHCESDMGFHPGSPGSRHGPKADAILLHHPGIPTHSFQLHMGHSTEQIISWPTNQPSTGTTGTRRMVSHHVHFRTTTLWNSKSTVRKNLDRPKIRWVYDHPTREWSNQEIKEEI